MVPETSPLQQPSCPAPEYVPRLLIELEPWPRVFLRNFLDLLFGRDARLLRLTSPPADFWDDVFVASRLPTRSFAESLLLHLIAAAVVYLGIIVPRPALTQARAFRRTTIAYYSISEYLPAVTAPAPAAPRPAPHRARKGAPRLARQEILSLPPRPDNFRQTIVDPVSPQLLRDDRPLPNLVAGVIAPPVPAAATQRQLHQLAAPLLPREVVAPAPRVVARDLAKTRVLPLGEVIAPPVQTSGRDLARLHVGVPTGDPIAPPPRAPGRDLSRDLARLQLPGRAADVVQPAASASGVVRRLDQVNVPTAATGAALPPPPPVVVPGAASGARLLAVGLEPATPRGPIELPGGSRAGEFALSPQGRADAPGTPDLSGDSSSEAAPPPGSAPAGSGVTIAAAPGARTASAVPTVALPTPPAAAHAALRPNLFASIPTRAADIARQTAPGAPPVQDEVFGPRKYYSMSLNMPNLGSVGGSCIVRFAEMKETSTGELIAPVATFKVDPAYPAELLREHLEGTVTLYAVIRADGSVTAVRVLHGIDTRLDESARLALAQWHFTPARKNGATVALEAVVQIPFRSRKLPF